MITYLQLTQNNIKNMLLVKMKHECPFLWGAVGLSKLEFQLCNAGFWPLKWECLCSTQASDSSVVSFPPLLGCFCFSFGKAVSESGHIFLLLCVCSLLDRGSWKSGHYNCLQGFKRVKQCVFSTLHTAGHLRNNSVKDHRSQVNIYWKIHET